jgi:hypothetical protein
MPWLKNEAPLRAYSALAALFGGFVMGQDQPNGGHQVERCKPPRAWRRRWRNALWVCPDCGQGWTSRKSDGAPPRRGDALGIGSCYAEGRFWTWWPWPKESRW